MSRQNVLSSPHLSELKKRNRKILIRKVEFFLFLSLLIFIALGFLSRWERMSIGEIEVTGNKVADTDQIVEVVKKETGGYYFWLYPKMNFLFYPKGGIESKLRDQFKVLKDISINIEDNKNLKISVSERIPAYTWCGDNFPHDWEVEQNKCYFMDESGYIFSLAPYFSGDVYFKFFGGVGGEGDEVMGSTFLPNTFQKISDFLDALRNMGLKPASLLVKNDENIEIYLSANALPPNAPKIILRRDFDLEKTVENLQTALSTEPLLTDLKKNYSSLVYIDLSFGNKVYYKFR